MREILRRLTHDVEMAIRIALAERLAEDADRAARSDPASGGRHHRSRPPADPAQPAAHRRRRAEPDRRGRRRASRSRRRRARISASRSPTRWSSQRREPCWWRWCATPPPGSRARPTRRWSRNPRPSRPAGAADPAAPTCRRTLATACATGCPTRSRPTSRAITRSRQRRLAEAVKPPPTTVAQRAGRAETTAGRQRARNSSTSSPPRASSRPASCCASCSQGQIDLFDLALRPLLDLPA